MTSKAEHKTLRIVVELPLFEDEFEEILHDLPVQPGVERAYRKPTPLWLRIGVTVFGLGLPQLPKIVLELSPIAIPVAGYVGKKAADIAVDALKSWWSKRRNRRPRSVKLYGPDGKVLRVIELEGDE